MEETSKNNLCPFCGAALLKSMSTTTGLRKLYACYSVFENGIIVDHRNRSCYRGQIESQAALLREALEIITEVYLTPAWDGRGDCCYCGRHRGHDKDCERSKAQALLPKLEAAVKEKWTQEEIDAARDQAKEWEKTIKWE